MLTFYYNFVLFGFYYSYQCLDFWLSILTHNKCLMDKYYNDDSFLRSKVVADRKLHTEMVQAIQPISLFTWDIDYKSMLSACTQSTDRGKPLLMILAGVRFYYNV